METVPKRLLRQSTNPTHREAGDMIVNGMASGKFITIMGYCEVQYSGRAEGGLVGGDCVVNLKQDGTILVHANENVKPKNWQPSGAETEVKLSDESGYLELHSHRSRKDEFLKVSFTDVYSVSAFAADSDVTLELSETEEDMHEYIMNNPSVIEEGFIPIENEKSVEFGSIDIFGEDSEGKSVIIEVKRRKAQIKHVDQLSRYYDEYTTNHPNTRGILVAPDISKKGRDILEKRNLEFVELNPKSLE